MDDSSWLVDLLQQTFSLRSWTAPLHGFIEAHCAAFAAGAVGEHPASLGALHARFRALVEELLETHLAAAGLSGEDFFALALHSPPGSELRAVIEEVRDPTQRYRLVWSTRIQHELGFHPRL